MIYDVDAARNQVQAPMFPGASGTLWGTHLSHWGTGGYMELPTIQTMYDIPTEGFLQDNKFSSGRRKFGMIVYVMETHQWFQLRPRNKDTNEYLSLAEYEALSDDEKRITLNPLESYTVTEFLDDDPWVIDTVYSGSGNPADCWTELCLSCGELQIIDVFADKTFLPEDANKIFHFHTTSTGNLNVSVDSSCPAGFNVAVNNVGTGFLLLNNSIKSVSNVIDAQHSGAFIYVKGPSDVYAVGRL